MNDDCLKLTTYFGERDREHGRRGGGVGGRDRLLADALLDLFGRERLLTSVLLRGAAGYGPGRGLATDRLLSLSEDLPVVAVAVDTRARIEPLLDEVVAIERRGTVTLERVRIVTGAGDASPALPEELHEATKLTAYVGRRQRVGPRPAFVAVCELLRGHGVAGATALLGVDGTRQGARARARFFGANADVPMMIVAVGAGERIAAAAATLRAALPDPLLTLERVRVCKRDGRLLARPHGLPGTDAGGLALWQQLTVYSSEQARHGPLPLHQALLAELRAAGVAGATCVRGIWGFHGDHEPHGDRLLALRRRVPVLTIAIDTPDRIAEAFDRVDRVTGDSGLVTSEMVPALSAVVGERRRGGLRLARHRF